MGNIKFPHEGWHEERQDPKRLKESYETFLQAWAKYMREEADKPSGLAKDWRNRIIRGTS